MIPGYGVSLALLANLLGLNYSVEFTDGYVTAVDANTFQFDANTGTANIDRDILVGVSWFNFNVHYDPTVSVDSVETTPVYRMSRMSTGPLDRAIGFFKTTVPTGTEANVHVSFGGVVGGITISTWRCIDINWDASYGRMAGEEGPSLTLQQEDLSYIVFQTFTGDGGVVNWTNATEVWDEETGGDGGSAAYVYSSNSDLVTVTGDGATSGYDILGGLHLAKNDSTFSPAAQVEYVYGGEDVGAGASYTHNNIDVGRTANNRYTIITCSAEGASSINSITVDGVSANLFYNSSDAIGYAIIDSSSMGATANIVFNYSDTLNRMAYGVYRAVNLESPDHVGSNTGSNVPAGVTLEVPAYGFAIAAAQTDDPCTLVWELPLRESYNTKTAENNTTMTGAYVDTDVDETFTFAAANTSGSRGGEAIAVFSWR